MKTAVVLALPLALAMGSALHARQGFQREHHALTAFDDSTAGLVLLDFDGDGDLDLLELSTGAFGGGAPDRLHRNEGQATFRDAASFFSASVGDSRAGAVGDADGDGAPDVFVAAGGQDVLLRSLSGFLFETSGQLPLDAVEGTSAVFGDVDGDGDLDLLVGTAAGQNRLLENDGSGTFSDVTAQLPVLADDTAGVALGDLDADGDLDAVVGNRLEPDRLHHNDGAGTFTDASLQMPGDTDDTRAVALVDVDGDGALDLATPERLYAGNGAGSLLTTAPAAYPGPGGAALAVEDLDGDGDLDVLTTEGMLLGDGAGLFVDASGLVSLPPGARRALAAGDLDGDADPDAALGLELVGFPILQDARNRILLNNGFGTLVDATEPQPSLPGDVEQTSAAALGDVDGDGDLDAFLTNVRDQAGGSFEVKSSLYLNDGTGTFTDGSGGLPLEHSLLLDVVLADVDGDADLDAVMAAQDNSDGTGGGLIVYTGDGAGTFVQGGSVGFWNALAVDVADVDGDGDVDAFLAADWADIPFSSDLFLNDGAGTFSSSGGVPANNDTADGVALGDLDGDGSVDAYLANRSNFLSDGADRLLLGDGGGGFADASARLPAFTDTGLDASLGDVDGDGDLDVLVGNDGQDRLLVNQGGSFADGGLQLPSVVARTAGIAFVDVDLDGDPDALLAVDGGPDLFYTNDGAANLGGPLQTASSEPRLSRGLALGDVDLDGDPDALFARAGRVDPPVPLTTGSRGPNGLWLNRRRHVRWVAQPRVGATLTFEVCGRGPSPYVLGVSLGLVTLPVPPFGTLFLDPGSLVVIGTGATGAPPNCTRPSFAIAPNPGLVGATLFAQALVDLAPTLTNVETVTFTAL